MKFRMLVEHADGQGEPWWEDYDKSNIPDPEAWCRRTVDTFNKTLRPKERARRLLTVEVLDANTDPEHRWEKQNAITQQDRLGSLYDTMKCAACGITGRLYGLRRGVVRDQRYRAKVYERCDTAQRHLHKAAKEGE